MFLSVLLVCIIWPVCQTQWAYKHGLLKLYEDDRQFGEKTPLHCQWRTVDDVSTNNLWIHLLATPLYSARWMPKSSVLCLYKVVYMVTVLTLRPYAPLILLLRCQSNFLAIWTECAELWNRCVCVLQAASCGALANRVCGGYDSPNVCIDPSFLPPMLVNRWSDGRQATGLRERERGRQRGRGRDGGWAGLQNRRKSSESWIMSCRHDRWVA